MLLLNLDHVAIAVRDLDEAVERYRSRYGVEPVYREVVEEQGVEEAMIPVGGSYLQLLQPLGPDTPVGRFVERRGEGLVDSLDHHAEVAVLGQGRRGQERNQSDREDRRAHQARCG